MELQLVNLAGVLYVGAKRTYIVKTRGTQYALLNANKNI